MSRNIWLGMALLATLSACNDERSAQVSSNGGVAIGVNNGSIVVSGSKVAGDSDLVRASGPEVTEGHEVENFHTIRLEAPVEATFTVADKPSISITGPQNIVPLVQARNQDGNLIVSVKKSFSMDGPLKVVVTGPSLRGVSLAGASSMKISGLTGDAFDLHVSGSGSVVAFGQVNRVIMNVSGSGVVDTSALLAKDITVAVAGSGRVQGYASKSAKVDVSGSGRVTIAGKPEQHSETKSGSGQVEIE